MKAGLTVQPLNIPDSRVMKSGQIHALASMRVFRWLIA